MLAPSTPIRLIVGLGNPGRDYARTRHNAGFWFVEALAAKAGGALAADKKFFGAVGKLGSGCWILEPTTFMNRSGQAVAALAGFYQIPADSILVVHDELDLKPGDVKLKLGGGVAGHNGLKDIQARLGTSGFWRLRIGIGHPRDQVLTEQEVVDYVLHRPGVDEQQLIDSALDKALAVWPDLEAGEIERAMHRLHTRPKPPKPPREEPKPEPPPQSADSAPSAAGTAGGGIPEIPGSGRRTG